MYTRIKSTFTGLSAAMAAIMISYAFGGAPSSPHGQQATQQAESIEITLGADANLQAEADAESNQGRNSRHMSRVLATPYLSVGRLLPRRGS